MDPMKNREGYHDPTACRAIQNVARKEHKGRAEMSRPLTYSLGEIRAFRKYAVLPGK